MKPTKLFALTIALAAAINLAGCGGGSGGGSEKKAAAAQKKSVPPVVEMVQKEGIELKNQTVSIKALKLESTVKGLAGNAYMPEMYYLDGAFYTISSKKDLVKLVLKDKKLVVDQPSLATNVSHLTGAADNRLFFRQQMPGKIRTHGLEKDKDVGEIYANLGYLTPTTDKNNALAWTNSGAFLKTQAKQDGTFPVPDVKQAGGFLPQTDPYITCGWFSVHGNRALVKGRLKSDAPNNQYVREHELDMRLVKAYGPSKDFTFGSFYLTDAYMVHARSNSKGLDVYSRKDGKLVANFTPKELGINSTYGCQIDENTIALLDHWTGEPKLVLISFK